MREKAGGPPEGPAGGPPVAGSGLTLPWVTGGVLAVRFAAGIGEIRLTGGVLAVRVGLTGGLCGTDGSGQRSAGLGVTSPGNGVGARAWAVTLGAPGVHVAHRLLVGGDDRAEREQREPAHRGGVTDLQPAGRRLAGDLAEQLPVCRGG